MHPIYSLVTKPINQNVAIIRISGDNVYKKVSDIFCLKIKKEKGVSFKKLIHKGDFIDDVLLLTFVAPNSFTGEDLIEIQCHGSQYVVYEILKLLEKTGMSQAKKGEFTERAFLNNKISLVQAQAINSLIKSETEIYAKQSLLNLDGKTENYLNEISKKLLSLISICFLNLDYPELKDIPKATSSKIKKEILEITKEISNILNESIKLMKIEDGVSISIIGEPNVGKSSLFNFLLNEERSIVTNIKGTTRDIVSYSLLINGIKVLLNDTAGIRETKNKIEKIGIKKTIEQAEKSDIVILLKNSVSTKEPEYIEKICKENKCIQIYTKSDLIKNKQKNSISVFKKDIKFLETELKKKINTLFWNKEEGVTPLLSSLQIDIMKEIRDDLQKLKSLDRVDIILPMIESVYKKINTILGKEIDPEYIEKTFGDFCLGK